MAALITAALIDRITGGDSERWLSPLSEACDAWDINTRNRVAFFLAQCAHESAGFRRLIENMKYSAAGLLRTWPQRFTREDAERMAYDEFAIAERAYGGRNGNRPEGQGDGFRYIARGPIGITFYNGYLRMGEHLGGTSDPELLVREPELLEQPIWGAFAAACFFDINGCDEAADDDDFERCTRIVNGGYNGLEDRRNWLGVVEEAMR